MKHMKHQLCIAVSSVDIEIEEKNQGAPNILSTYCSGPLGSPPLRGQLSYRDLSPTEGVSHVIPH